MRCSFRTILAAACVGIFALSVPAYGKPAAKAAQFHKRADEKMSSKTSAKAANISGKRVGGKARQVRDLRYGTTKRVRPLASRGDDSGALRTLAPISQLSARPTFGWPALVTEARKYIGTNPTALNKRWCARFMNLVLTKAGYSGTGSDAARSFASYGRRVSEPRVGAIAVLSRGRNSNLGHVGVVTGIDPRGNPIIISGNHGRRVGEGIYSRNRVIAYVMPAEQPQLARASGTNASDADREGIASPIAELLAAINNESPRDQRRAPVPPAPERIVQQAPQSPPVRALLVEQMPQSAVPPVPQIVRVDLQADRRRVDPRQSDPGQAGRRDVPLDPALARLLGVKSPNGPAPRRRVAAAR